MQESDHSNNKQLLHLRIGIAKMRSWQPERSSYVFSREWEYRKHLFFLLNKTETNKTKQVVTIHIFHILSNWCHQYCHKVQTQNRYCNTNKVAQAVANHFSDFHWQKEKDSNSSSFLLLPENKLIIRAICGFICWTFIFPSWENKTKQNKPQNPNQTNKKNQTELFFFSGKIWVNGFLQQCLTVWGFFSVFSKW